MSWWVYTVRIANKKERTQGKVLNVLSEWDPL